MTIEEIKNALDSRLCPACRSRICDPWNRDGIKNTMKCGLWHWRKEQLISFPRLKPGVCREPHGSRNSFG